VGVLLALGAQIFILPNLDSIAGFTVLFIVLSVPAAWIATSSPRLSYFGLQIAVAIYLINLVDFSVQTSLYPARDRVIGIFLGLLMMWLVFDRFGAVSAVTAMKKSFVEVLRLLAQFNREPVSSELAVATESSLSVRERINQEFSSVRALADGVLLEFGPSRDRDLAWREDIIQWQPQLRILFLTRITLWKYRARLPGFELPETVRAAQQRFDEELAKKLDAMADWMEGKTLTQTDAWVNLLEPLERAIREARCEDASAARSALLENFLRLCRTIGNLTNSLEQEIRDAQMQLPHGTASEAHA
jgi:multidrug resistance protein MdtO